MTWRKLPSLASWGTFIHFLQKRWPPAQSTRTPPAWEHCKFWSLLYMGVAYSRIHFYLCVRNKNMIFTSIYQPSKQSINLFKTYQFHCPLLVSLAVHCRPHMRFEYAVTRFIHQHEPGSWISMVRVLKLHDVVWIAEPQWRIWPSTVIKGVRDTRVSLRGVGRLLLGVGAPERRWRGATSWAKIGVGVTTLKTGPQFKWGTFFLCRSLEGKFYRRLLVVCVHFLHTVAMRFYLLPSCFGQTMLQIDRVDVITGLSGVALVGARVTRGSEYGSCGLFWCKGLKVGWGCLISDALCLSGICVAHCQMSIAVIRG